MSTTAVFGGDVPIGLRPIEVQYRRMLADFGFTDPSVPLVYYRSEVGEYVFCLPMIVPGSTDKTVAEQQALLSALQERYQLPTHHFTIYGLPTFLGEIIDAYRRATGQRLAPFPQRVRTDAVHDGKRFIGRSWDYSAEVSGEHVMEWDDDKGYPELGCFGIGIEPA